MKNRNVLIVIGILVIIFLTFLIFRDKKEEAEVLVEDTIEEALVVEVEEIEGLTPALGVNTENGSYVIDVENQLAGSEVIISSVFMPEMGWVAVRENVKGNLGNVLGARRLESGNNFNVLVSLQRGTLPNEIYHVVLYKDDGDRLFDLKTDELIFSGEGNLIVSSFGTFE